LQKCPQKEQAKREQARRGTPKINTGLEGIHKNIIQAID
jgi:RNA-binding protein YhbY